MELVIRIKCDEDAFYTPDGDFLEHIPGPEVARILGKLASGCAGADLPDGPIMDFNGNCVGSAEVIK